MRSMTQRGGFTLVEVLVGLTVAALAMTAGMLALGGVQDRADHAESAAHESIGGATQRGMLVDWLTSARSRGPMGEEFYGMQTDEGGAVVDQLLFATTARTPLGHGATVVGLFVDTDPETPERGLVAEMSSVELGPETRRMELVPEVGRMQIRYFTIVQGVPVWESEWQNRRGLPRLVEITLYPAPGETLPLLLQLPVRAALAGGL
jgi:prepilin-type N-terminal cleavage/methylation domain-containing protein